MGQAHPLRIWTEAGTALTDPLAFCQGSKIVNPQPCKAAQVPPYPPQPLTEALDRLGES